MRALILGIALAGSLVAPAMAAEFYIVQDTATKKCTIVSQKPTTSTTVVVGDGKVYTSQTEAEAAVKTVKVCETK